MCGIFCFLSSVPVRVRANCAIPSHCCDFKGSANRPLIKFPTLVVRTMVLLRPIVWARSRLCAMETSRPIAEHAVQHLSHRRKTTRVKRRLHVGITRQGYGRRGHGPPGWHPRYNVAKTQCRLQNSELCKNWRHIVWGGADKTLVQYIDCRA